MLVWKKSTWVLLIVFLISLSAGIYANIEYGDQIHRLTGFDEEQLNYVLIVVSFVIGLAVQSLFQNSPIRRMNALMGWYWD